MPSTPPGNIGTGKRTYADLTLDAPLDKLWSGLHVRLRGNIQRTRVDDPITGKPRDWSGFYPRWQWDGDIRRDAGKLAYGLSVQDRAKITFFRTDALDISYNVGPPHVGAFVEYRRNANQKLTLNLDNISSGAGARDLVFYDPDRRNFRPQRQRASLPQQPRADRIDLQAELRRGRRQGQRRQPLTGRGWRSPTAVVRARHLLYSSGAETPWVSLNSCRSTGRILSTSIIN